MLQKHKLKGPWRITFDTNPDLCNLHCIMCEERSRYKKSINRQNRLMDFDIIRKVIDDSIEFGLKEVIPSTMGEPLLYTHFEELLDLIKGYDLRLNLTTNGTFPGLGAEKWAEIIMPITSDIKISINGAFKETSESIMEGINFEQQLENIKRIVEIRDKIRETGLNYPTITFQVTFMERNIEEFPALLNLAINMDIDRFKGHHLWITHQELFDESLRRNKESIQRWNKTVKTLYMISEQNCLKNMNKIKLDNINELKNYEDNLIPKSWICPFLGKEAWIAWDGTFNVCCAPNDLRKTLGYFGNVKETNLIELWNSPEYDGLISNWGTYKVCSQCNMRRPLL
ncbi:MAG: radical SAM/SPASM domain-containing protein [Promethearchaeota archaeon]